MKTVKKFVKSLITPNTKKAFYLLVKCSECQEEVKVRINSSSDFQTEYNPRNPEHRYTVKKEIIGRNCFNLMRVTLALTKAVKTLYVDCSGCTFMAFDRE